MILRTSFFLLVLAFAGCLADTTISLSDFHTDCVHDEDCVVVQVGDICGCDCGNAAINVNGLPAYQQELATKGSHCSSKVFCGCTGTSAVCISGQCAFKRP